MHERVLFMSGCGMDYQSRWFVDDQQIGVFKEDAQLEVDWSQLHRSRFWRLYGDAIAGFWFMRGFCLCRVYQDMPLFDPFSQDAS